MRIAVQVGDHLGREVLDETLGVDGSATMVKVGLACMTLARCLPFRRRNIMLTCHHGVLDVPKDLHLLVVGSRWSH